MKDEKMYTVAEAAKEIGLNSRFFLYLINRGEEQVDGRMLYDIPIEIVTTGCRGAQIMLKESTIIQIKKKRKAEGKK